MAKKTEVKESNLLKELNAKYGKGSVILGSEKDDQLQVVDSGSIMLNRALQCGGIPIGKLIEVYGPESSGKSTICQTIMGTFQKDGRKVALIDGEHSFDRTYAEKLGVEMESVMILSPANGEEAYNMALDIVKSGEYSLVVIDSHTSLVPKKVVESEVGEATIGLQARVNSIGVAKLHDILERFGCTVIAISQLRTVIGAYGDPNQPTGGQAYKFYSDIRLKVSKQLEKTDAINRTTVEVTKNKCGIPFGKATFAINWGKGIDRIGEVIDLAVEQGIIKKGGAWYELPTASTLVSAKGETAEAEGIVKFQGEAKVHEFLEDNPEYLVELETKLA